MEFTTRFSSLIQSFESIKLEMFLRSHAFYSKIDTLQSQCEEIASTLECSQLYLDCLLLVFTHPDFINALRSLRKEW